MDIACDEPDLYAVIHANFGQLADPMQRGPAALEYRVARSPGSRISLGLHTGEILDAADRSELVYLLETLLTIELQLRRPDLLFLHAACVEHRGRAWLFAGDSGAGKSTTAWALLHHGCRYLTDELSAVDLVRLEVHPYPHALCLKQAPPPAYPLADDALDLGPTIHLPAASLHGASVRGARPLAGLFLLQPRGHQAREPEVRRLTASEAAARLYVAALNPLAHPQHGIDAVLRLAQRFPCFALRPGELRSTCAALVRQMQLHS
jgi:hypothetical protein